MSTTLAQRNGCYGHDTKFSEKEKYPKMKNTLWRHHMTSKTGRFRWRLFTRFKYKEEEKDVFRCCSLCHKNTKKKRFKKATLPYKELVDKTQCQINDVINHMMTQFFLLERTRLLDADE